MGVESEAENLELVVVEPGNIHGPILGLWSCDCKLF
jgi:hypothetical protein